MMDEKPLYILMLVSVSNLVLVKGQNTTTRTVDYIVHTKTGVGPGCGTDSTFNLTFIGADNMNITFLLDGEGEKLETSKRDNFEYQGQLIYPIDRIKLQRAEKKGWSPDWYIHWLTVDLNDSLYVFRINRWIRNDAVYQYYGTLGSCKDGYKRIQECKKIE